MLATRKLPLQHLLSLSLSLSLSLTTWGNEETPVAASHRKNLAAFDDPSST
jgi:hypothetical protein